MTIARFRFSLRALLVVIVAVAIGMALGSAILSEHSPRAARWVMLCAPSYVATSMLVRDAGPVPARIGEYRLLFSPDCCTASMPCSQCYRVRNGCYSP
jgi:hypothetical protein